MPAAGYSDDAQALVLAGVDVYPPLTLKATAQPHGIIEIVSLDSSVEFSGSYMLLTRLDGTAFVSQDEAMTYLNAQFSKMPSYTSSPANSNIDGGTI